MGKLFNSLMIISTASAVLTPKLMANAANLPPMDAAPVFAPMPANSCSNCATAGTRDLIRSGVYGGLQLGYEQMRINYNSTYTNNIGPVVSSSRVTSSKGGFSGDVILGGRMVYSNCFVAGLEVAGTFTTGKNSRNQTLGGANLTYRTKRSVSVVPSIVLGWLINDQFMLYEKTGWVTTEMNTQVTHAAVLPTQKYSKKVMGVAPVLGLEFAANKLFSVRAEVGMEIFGRKSKLFTFNQDTLSLLRNSIQFHTKLGLIAKL